MKKTVTAIRVAALLGAMGGASALLVSAATPAKAAEERLHGTSFKVYGLVPPGEGNKSSTNAAAGRSATADMSMTTKTTKGGAGKGSTADNEPKLEDPPLPSYDGPAGDGNAMASNAGANAPDFN